MLFDAVLHGLGTVTDVHQVYTPGDAHALGPHPQGGNSAAARRLGGGIAAYDEVHRHILQMADVLSEGIMKQFPGRFN